MPSQCIRKRQGCSPIACILYGSWSSLYYVIDLQLNTCSEKRGAQLFKRKVLYKRSLSKWFYDTSTSAATGAARCGSFVGGAQIARGVGYPRILWTRRLTWFGPPERNTLRPRVNGIVLLCLGAQLRSSLFSLCQPVCVWSSSARTFYSPRSGSYREAP
jgi:hypothetical protein